MILGENGFASLGEDNAHEIFGAEYTDIGDEEFAHLFDLTAM